MHVIRQESRHCATRGAFLFAVVAVVWLLFSDRIATLLFWKDPAVLAWVQTGKGLVFIIVLSVLVGRRIYASSIQTALHMEQYLTITNQLRVEREQHMVQAARLQSVITFAGGIAHDMATPLTVIEGNVDMIITTIGDVGECNQRETLAESLTWLGDVRLAVETLIGMMRTLRTYAGEETVVRTVCDIHTVLAKSVDNLRHAARGVQLDLKLEATYTEVAIHAPQIHQVVQNLVMNAFEALGGQSSPRIVVRTWNADMAVAVPHGLLGNAQKNAFALIIEVRDNGHGIPASAVDRVFEPFFSTKHEKTRRGQGLTVVLGAVLAHGGDIAVRSTPQDTCFTIGLPCVAP